MKYGCVFCGKEKEGYGHSCWPIHNDEKVRCCNGCNQYVVIPARLAEMEKNSASRLFDDEENLG